VTGNCSAASPTAPDSARRGPWQLCAALLATAVLLFGAVTVARADAFVVLGDPHLRTAIASQLATQGQIPPGSDGTTLTPSDMQALTTLTAPARGIAKLDGLESATALTSLDLSGNEIATITPLAGLTHLTDVDLVGNRLDVTAGSPAMTVIAALQGLGAHVSYQPQRASLSAPTVSSSASTFGKWVTFSGGITPRGAATSGASVVRLYHLETKTVTVVSRGTTKKVAVNYWRLRKRLTMKVGSAQGLSVTGKLPYAGKWQAQVAFAGSPDYGSCASTATAFVVQDPRIPAAISWATRKLGSHAWDHYCYRFVCDCYAKGAHASVTRYSNAKQAADALHAAAQRSANAPRGALVFYHSMHGSTDLGHVGISLGNGTMINDNGGEGVKIMRISSPRYIGWAAPPLSPPIVDWKQPTKT